MIDQPKQLLSELLRPRRLEDLFLPRRDLDRLERMVNSGSLPNLAFYGDPGGGKTSAARLLISTLGPESSTEINGSSATGIAFVRDYIEEIAKSVCLFDGIKICFIDEADYMSKSAQAALRKVIEDYSDNCRFLMAANEIDKLIPAMRSRFVEICFDIPVEDRDEVEARLIDRYKRTLSELGIPFDQGRLAELIGTYYPDLRSIANQVEYEFEF